MQYPEKLIPLFIAKALKGEKLPVYGDGLQERQWLHVQDLCAALYILIKDGVPGEAYNIAPHVYGERTNLDVVEKICEHAGQDYSLIEHVKDRPGHDRRYNMISKKIFQLGWEPELTWQDGFDQTFQWYRGNQGWCEKRLEESKAYFERQYGG
jgi:dTDP-glucose 4,6-dehydratase